MRTETNFGLVLSGGGARGAFQVGVWKAFRELGIESGIKSVFGTSVGAINGAAIVQGDFDAAVDIWNQVEYKRVFNDPDLIRAQRYTGKYYYSLAKAVLKDKGLDVTPLKNLLREILDEDKLRSSPIDFGLVVFDLSNRKPRYLKKEHVPEGKLIEYIIASATFPLFQPHRIEDEIYLDGGIYDNRPLGFLKEEDHIKKVYCVDVTIARHFWPNKKVNRDIEVHYLRPSRLLGSPLAFRPSRIRRNLLLGYKDALEQLSV